MLIAMNRGYYFCIFSCQKKRELTICNLRFRKLFQCFII